VTRRPAPYGASWFTPVVMLGAAAGWQLFGHDERTEVHIVGRGMVPVEPVPLERSLAIVAVLLALMAFCWYRWRRQPMEDGS